MTRSQDDLKLEVAKAALDTVKPHLDSDTILGIGTGSTANFFIDQLAEVRHLFDGCVASSEASAQRLQSHGIKVYDLNAVASLSHYIDGADEFNARGHLVKGGGGALTREKIVAAVAKSFICIVDASKEVGCLGKFPLPVEVIPMARSHVARQLVLLGGDPVYREDFVTDNGNIILDVHNLEIHQPIELEEAINQITGVVSNGLFAARGANCVLMGTQAGVTELKF